MGHSSEGSGGDGQKKSPERREAHRSFRITAVRRRPASLVERLFRESDARPRIPVADEEVIEALWRQRAEFEAQVGAALLRESRLRITVTLEDLRPAQSVLAVVRFAAESAENLEDALAGAAAAVTVAVATVLREQLGDVASAAVPVPPAPVPAPASDAAEAQTTAWERLAPFLGTLATGVGVVGFTTFIGAVILSGRLSGAGFPAEAALGVVPAQDMLVIGAETLVPTVVIGLLLVALLFVLFVIVLGFLGRLSRDDAHLVEEQGPRLRALGIFALVAAALGGAVVYNLTVDLPAAKAAWILPIAVSVALLPAAVARVTSRLAYIVVATFVTTGVFLTFLAYERALTPKYRGAAVIRQNKRATIGFFVAEGATRVYLARSNLKPGTSDIIERTSRLVGIDKSQISDWAVGAPSSAENAVAQAKDLAREMCALQPQAVPATAKPTAGAGQAASQPQPEDCFTAPPGVTQP